MAKTAWLEKETAGAGDGLSMFMSVSARMEMGAGTSEMHGEGVLPRSRVLEQNTDWSGAVRRLSNGLKPSSQGLTPKVAMHELRGNWQGADKLERDGL